MALFLFVRVGRVEVFVRLFTYVLFSAQLCYFVAVRCLHVCNSSRARSGLVIFLVDFSIFMFFTFGFSFWVCFWALTVGTSIQTPGCEFGMVYSHACVVAMSDFRTNFVYQCVVFWQMSVVLGFVSASCHASAFWFCEPYSQCVVHHCRGAIINAWCMFPWLRSQSLFGKLGHILVVHCRHCIVSTSPRTETMVDGLPCAASSSNIKVGDEHRFSKNLDFSLFLMNIWSFPSLFRIRNCFNRIWNLIWRTFRRVSALGVGFWLFSTKLIVSMRRLLGQIVPRVSSNTDFRKTLIFAIFHKHPKLSRRCIAFGIAPIAFGTPFEDFFAQYQFLDVYFR